MIESLEHWSRVWQIESNQGLIKLILVASYPGVIYECDLIIKAVTVNIAKIIKNKAQVEFSSAIINSLFDECDSIIMIIDAKIENGSQRLSSLDNMKCNCSKQKNKKTITARHEPTIANNIRKDVQCLIQWATGAT